MFYTSSYNGKRKRRCWREEGRHQLPPYRFTLCTLGAFEPCPQLNNFALSNIFLHFLRLLKGKQGSAPTLGLSSKLDASSIRPRTPPTRLTAHTRKYSQACLLFPIFRLRPFPGPVWGTQSQPDCCAVSPISQPKMSFRDILGAPTYIVRSTVDSRFGPPRGARGELPQLLPHRYI